MMMITNDDNDDEGGGYVALPRLYTLYPRKIHIGLVYLWSLESPTFFVDAIGEKDLWRQNTSTGITLEYEFNKCTWNDFCNSNDLIAISSQSIAKTWANNTFNSLLLKADSQPG